MENGVHERIRTSDPRIHTTSAFAAASAFVVWTVPSPWAKAFRCCPSSLYTLPRISPGLGSGLACCKFSEAFPDFEQLDCMSFQIQPPIEESCALSC